MFRLVIMVFGFLVFVVFVVVVELGGMVFGMIVGEEIELLVWIEQFDFMFLSFLIYF